MENKQKGKSIQECKNEVANNYGFEDWGKLLDEKSYWGTEYVPERINKFIDEAILLYSQQSKEPLPRVEITEKDFDDITRNHPIFRIGGASFRLAKYYAQQVIAKREEGEAVRFAEWINKDFREYDDLYYSWDANIEKEKELFGEIQSTGKTIKELYELFTQQINT